MISYFMLIHIGLPKGVTLLEFEEEAEENQETPHPVALKGEEPSTDHRPTSFLKGKPQSILSLICFTKYHLSPLCLMH